MPFQALSSGKKLENQVRVRFYKWFKESKLTQAQAGAAIEWSQQSVAGYFAGEQQIDLVRAVAWAAFFGYTYIDLLGKVNAKPANPRVQMLIDGFNRHSAEMQTALLGVVCGPASRVRRGRPAREVVGRKEG